MDNPISHLLGNVKVSFPLKRTGKGKDREQRDLILNLMAIEEHREPKGCLKSKTRSMKHGRNGQPVWNE